VWVNDMCVFSEICVCVLKYLQQINIRAPKKYIHVLQKKTCGWVMCVIYEICVSVEVSSTEYICSKKKMGE